MHFLSYHKGKRHYVAIKIDMEKAFDLIEWSLLLRIMKCIGFEENLIQWVLDTSPHYPILLLSMGAPLAFSGQLEE